MYQYIALYSQANMYSECRSTTESYHSIAETHWSVSTGPKRTKKEVAVLAFLLVRCFFVHYPSNSNDAAKFRSAQPSCSWLTRKPGSKTKPCQSPTICWLMVRCWYCPYHIPTRTGNIMKLWVCQPTNPYIPRRIPIYGVKISIILVRINICRSSNMNSCWWILKLVYSSCKTEGLKQSIYNPYILVCYVSSFKDIST
jgi:hypothetical protein